jgi:DNA-binding PadR family transcriptional regulator
MTSSRELTNFEHILLAHLGATPMSGYELKRHFRTTPAAVYEPSAGALYPALHRLEERGLLHAETTPTEPRGRRVYQPTAAGHAATQRWVREPVNQETVGRDLGLHLMRFVLMEPLLPPDEVRAFLVDLASALEAVAENIEHYVASTPLPGRHPALALEHGLVVHRASLEWARNAEAALAEHVLDVGRGERRKESGPATAAGRKRTDPLLRAER